MKTYQQLLREFVNSQPRRQTERQKNRDQIRVRHNMPGGRHKNVFTALHGMQRGLNDEISVRLSVRLSVCQTRAL